MDRKNENRQNIEQSKWNPKTFKAFVHIVYDRMKKTRLEVSAFNTEIWDDIKTEMQNITGQIFDVENLKRKFDYMRDYPCSAEEVWDYTTDMRQNIEPSRWNPENLKAFTDIVYDRIRKTRLQVSAFNKEIWEDIKNELQNITGQTFDVENLKKKLDYMTRYHYSSGEVWDYTSNTSAHVSKGDHIDRDAMDVDGDGRQKFDRKRKSMEPLHVVEDGMQDIDRKRKSMEAMDAVADGMQE